MTEKCHPLPAGKLIRSWRCVLACFGLNALALFAAGQATPAPSPALPPGVRVAVSAQPKTATVGDPITIEVEVAHPAGYRVRMPRPGTQLGDFTLLEFTAAPPPAGAARPDPVAPEHDRLRLAVAVYKTGTFTLAPLPLTVTAPDGKEFPATTPAVVITIQSVLTDKDTDLKDLKSQAEIEEPFPWRTWLAVAAAVLLGSVLAWWLLRRRRRPALPEPGTPPQLDPLEIAEVELRDLAARGWIENGLMKQFYVSLSDVLRKILEGGFSVTTVEKTTTEIIEALQNSANPRPEEARLSSIESLLMECDLVKFAKFVPPREEAGAALKVAIELLGFCKALRAAPVPAAGPVVEVK